MVEKAVRKSSKKIFSLMHVVPKPQYLGKVYNNIFLSKAWISKLGFFHLHILLWFDCDGKMMKSWLNKKLKRKNTEMVRNLWSFFSFSKASSRQTETFRLGSWKIGVEENETLIFKQRKKFDFSIWSFFQFTYPNNRRQNSILFCKQFEIFLISSNIEIFWFIECNSQSHNDLIMQDAYF